MKLFSDNFLSLVLLLILAVSPVQNSIASINHTMTMALTMESSAPRAMQQKMPASSTTDIQKNHCPGHQSNQCKCDVSHCTNVSFIVLPITNNSNLAFTHVEYAVNSNTTFIQPVISSLFRPPRV